MMSPGEKTLMRIVCLPRHVKGRNTLYFQRNLQELGDPSKGLKENRETREDSRRLKEWRTSYSFCLFVCVWLHPVVLTTHSWLYAQWSLLVNMGELDCDRY